MLLRDLVERHRAQGALLHAVWSTETTRPGFRGPGLAGNPGGRRSGTCAGGYMVLP